MIIFTLPIDCLVEIISYIRIEHILHFMLTCKDFFEIAKNYIDKRKIEHMNTLRKKSKDEIMELLLDGTLNFFIVKELKNSGRWTPEFSFDDLCKRITDKEAEFAYGLRTKMIGQIDCTHNVLEQETDVPVIDTIPINDTNITICYTPRTERKDDWCEIELRMDDVELGYHMINFIHADKVHVRYNTQYDLVYILYLDEGEHTIEYCVSMRTHRLIYVYEYKLVTFQKNPSFIFQR